MRCALFAALACAALGATPALAQQGVASYPAVFFAANQPATAFDMVSLLPGFHLVPGDATIRGFSGTVGNVLIDGQLPTSKEEKLDELLRRIAASSVERIELIRGAADMHGYPVLANVVRVKNTALRGRAEAEGIITHYGTTAPKLAVHLTRQGATSLWEMTALYARDFGMQNPNGFGTRARYLPGGAPLQLSRYNFPKLTNIAELSSAYRQPLWNGDLALGVLVKQERIYSRVSEDIYFPAASLASGLESARARSAEGRLDYRHGLNAWGQLQLFAIHRMEEQDEISQTSTAARTDMSRSRFNLREDVARLAWLYQRGALKLENGAEGAINTLSSRSTLTLAGAPVILPAANVRVQEKRVEFFSTATWRFSPVLMTELGVRYETSTLTQSGDSSLTKDLSFLKPRWLTSWNPAPGHELRLLLERQVGQLVFRDFASSTSLNSNIVTGGNKNLEPAHSWNISLAWERHFWDRGSLVLEAKREFISQVVDRIPVFVGAAVYNAVGNIGSGTRDDIQADLILPLDRVGLKGLTIKGQAISRHSRVRDPATGEHRTITGGQTFGGTAFVFTSMTDITYDIPERNLQLGMNIHYHAGAEDLEYRIDEIDSTHHDIKLGAYVEYKPTPVWTMRGFVKDLTQTSAYRDRNVYGGLRGTAPLVFIERRKLNNGAMFGVNVQHDF